MKSFACWVAAIIVSLIWWPGMTTLEASEQHLSAERLWFETTFDESIVETKETLARTLHRVVTANPLPSGDGTSITKVHGATDEELESAAIRVSEKPYFASLTGLVSLAIWRIAAVLVVSAVFLPVTLAFFVDALVVREIRFLRFKPARTLVYRWALTLLTGSWGWVSVAALLPWAWPAGLFWTMVALPSIAAVMAIGHFWRS